jgi:methylated-DNA-[protein]-cysteine S-methyltransferase
MARLSRSRFRAVVRALVVARDFGSLRELCDRELDTPYRVVALVFEPDDDLRGRAIEALGKVAAALDESGRTEKVRGIVRRLFWLMNDESGGIAWHGPEAIAEVLDAVPTLLGEYGRIVASFIDEPPFGPGVHRAVARLAAAAPDQFEHVRERLERSLGSDDPVERAHAVVALVTLSPAAARAAAERLASDEAEVRVYDPQVGAFRSTTVGALVRPFTARGARAA